MAEELKELIEKIQAEGVKAAEDKATEIETHAKKRADEIVAAAQKEAARMIAEAKAEIEKLEEGAKDSVRQASRDTLLSLRKEIASMLERITAAHIHKALSAEELEKIIVHIVRSSIGEDREKIVISMKKEDLDKVERALLSELAHELRKGITLKPAADVRGGFLISYDSGRSYFDFSDKTLAEYMSFHLKKALADIVKEAVS